MPKLTPSQAREKHANRLKASTSEIRRGVENVTVAPGVKAAEKVEKMKMNLMQSIDSGQWQKRVASVGVDTWKNKMINKGIPRIASGVDAAAEDIENFFEQLFVYQEKAQADIARMPDLTLEDNLNRMVTFVRKMADFRRK